MSINPESKLCHQKYNIFNQSGQKIKLSKIKRIKLHQSLFALDQSSDTAGIVLLRNGSSKK